MAITQRPDDTSLRVSLGCAAAFLGLFLLAGLAALAAGIASGRDGRAVAIGVGVAFVAVSGGGLLLVRWVWRQAAEKERRRAAAPGQPWAWKQDLGSGVVKGQSPSASVLLFGLFAGLWVGMVALVTVLAWDRIAGETGLAVFLGVFWLAGLLLSGLALNAILHARRFGRSTLVPDRVPARLGGWLSGVIHAPLAVQGAEAELTVECERTTHSSHGSSRSSSRTALWRVTKLLDGAHCRRTSGGVEIPFAVRLPTSEEAARDANRSLVAEIFRVAEVDLAGEDVDWYVRVSAALPGVDWSDRFMVPVGAAEAAATEPDRPPREMPEVSAERLASRLPGRLEYEPDADVFVFPLKTSAIVWTIAFFVPALLLPLRGASELLARVPPGVLHWVAIGCGGLGALALLGLLLETRRIEITAAAVRIRRGLMGVGLHRTIPRAEIAEVEEETSKSEPPSYLVNIRLRSGKRYWAIPPVSEKDRAAALAARLRQVLQIG